MHIFSLILATMIWAGTFPLMKVAVQNLSPSCFVFLRFFLTSIVLLPIFIYKIKRINKTVFMYSMLSGILVGSSIWLQTAGIKTIAASFSAFIIGSAIVFVLIIKSITTKKLPSLVEVITTSICILGLGFITLNFSDTLTIEIGIAFTIMSTVLVAFGVLLNDKIAKLKDRLIIISLQNVFACLIFSGSFFQSINFIPYLSLQEWFAISYCGIGSSIIAWNLQTFAQRKLDPKMIAMIFMLEPIFSSILSFFFLDEDVFSSNFVFGSLLILGSLSYLSYKSD